MRVHLRSKRWPVAHAVDWRGRVVHLAQGYVVVDKPAGVQCTPSEDNVLECVPACVERVRATTLPLSPALWLSRTQPCNRSSPGRGRRLSGEWFMGRMQHHVVRGL